MTSHIRTMTQADKIAIMNILSATPEFKPSEVLVAAELIDYYLDDPIASGYHIYVMESEARITGYICYGPTPLTNGAWDIYWIAITPSRQRQGAGTALITYAEDQMNKAAGRISLIETSSKPEYEKTRRFYIKHGYEIISRIPDFYEPGDDKVTFWKRFR